MDLWIRSQDRETLLKVEKIKKYDVYSQKAEKQNYMPRNATSYDDMRQVTSYVDDKYLRTIIVANDVEVAEYKTKARALEVLDQIQRLIEDLQYINYAIPNKEFTGYRPNVYEMPKE